jgi:hypothetical protein
MIPGSINALLLGEEAGAAGGYSISRSLRFNSSDSAYLSRTPASAGNRKTWTYSFWFKLAKVTGYQYFLSANDPSGSGSNYDILQMDNNASTIAFYGYNGSSFDWLLSSDAVFRDPSAWQHFVISFDTTQSTASNRVKWWHNGNLLTLNRSGYTTYPSLNTESRINNTVSQRISDQTYGLSSYVADIHFCDGTAYDASAFGEFDANGIWQPKKFAGVYGASGFKLSFSDNSTAAALGTDTSGNGNTWTVNNISVTAGAGNDSLVDVPTNGSEVDTGSGGQVRGNYATLNPLSGTGTLANGNLDVSASFIRTSTIAASTGKWYFEVLVGSIPENTYFGGYLLPGSFGQGLVTYRVNTGEYDGGGGYSGTGSFSASATTGDLLGLAYNLDAGTFQVFKNGSSIGTISGIPFNGKTIHFGGHTNGSATIASVFNFGQRPFAYTAPSGFKALCTANLPAPVITKPSDVMDVKLYTGNGSTQTISGLGFSPDFVWLKKRNGATSHRLFDVVRGATKNLYSNTTDAEGTDSTSLSSFDSTGFSLGDNGAVNALNDTYAAWAWDAGSSTVTNTQGSITSSVRANPSAGFSIVTYTGAVSSPAKVGHGLNATPAFVIVKPRSTSDFWVCYHSAFNDLSKYIVLSSTSAVGTAASNYWGTSSDWNSSTFGVYPSAGSNNNLVGVSHVAYCFAPVAGYASMGSFVANANSDGPFVYTSFKPRLVLCKLSSASGADWLIFDTARSPYNVVQANLRPNTSGAEESAFARIDILSNGFKVRAGSGVEPNGTNGNTYIYAAWAESPFNYSRAA